MRLPTPIWAGRQRRIIYWIFSFIICHALFPFSTQDIAIITWKECRETTSLLLFLECRPGFVVFRYSLHRCHRASEHWQVPKQEDRQQQLWSHPREVSYLSFTHTPVHKNTRVHSQGICKVKIFRLMKQYARQIAGSFQTNCRVWGNFSAVWGACFAVQHLGLRAYGFLVGKQQSTAPYILSNAP